MIIKSIRAKNFRSIKDATLICENLSVLVGGNGAGKSSFFKAIEVFYNPSTVITEDDYHNKKLDEEIAISITFTELTKSELDVHSAYVDEKVLTVEYIVKWDGRKAIGKYHGATLRNGEFAVVREALELSDRGATAKKEYSFLRGKEKYSSLPAYGSKGATEEALVAWEKEHPGECIRMRDAGQYFGFKEVGQGKLEKHTKFILIPAVRDASDDAEEGRDSYLSELMELLVRSAISNRKEFRDFRERAKEEYSNIMNPENIKELDELSSTMTETLQTFVKNAEVDLSWRDLPEPTFPLPQADMRLVEDDYKATVTRVGHGLQRALIFTIFQHLAMAQENKVIETVEAQGEGEGNDEELGQPNLIIAIEEPELYQHPSRQRHLSDILSQIAKGTIPGVAKKTQILYSTHSPLFVGMDRINQVRLIKKSKMDNSSIKQTTVAQIDVDAIAEKLWELNGALGEKYTAESVLARLGTIMTPMMNEGFFANVIVLVEGEGDKAVLHGIAKVKKIDFEEQGVSVIPCMGKTNIDRPYLIFKKFGIDVFIMWDGDYGKGQEGEGCEKCGRGKSKAANPSENRRILAMLGRTEQDWPDEVTEEHACLKVDLETTIKEEIGEDEFAKSLSECCEEFGMKKRYALKNPYVIESIVGTNREKGRICSTLEKVVDKVIAMKNRKDRDC